MKKKPKIGFLIPRLGTIDRGAEVFVFELSQALLDKFQIEVWVKKSLIATGLVEKLIKKGITVRKVSCLSENNFWAKVFYRSRRLKPIIDKLQLNPVGIEMLSFSLACLPQLVASNCNFLFPVNGIWGAVVCRLVRWLKKTPFVYSGQGGIEPLIAKQKPDLYFVINQETKRWYQTHFPQMKTVFIPNGVNLERFTPFGPKVSFGLEKPIFLSVGALIPAKKIEDAIRAVAKLGKGSLVVLGQGPLRPQILQSGKRFLGPNRFLLQSVSHLEIAPYYRSADFFVFPAEAGEPFSLVVLEALASNLPVVAKDDEIRRLMIEEAGVLADTDNLGNFSEALKEIQKKQFGDLPQRQAEKFSWVQIAQTYKKELFKLIA